MDSTTIYPVISIRNLVLSRSSLKLSHPIILGIDKADARGNGNQAAANVEMPAELEENDNAWDLAGKIIHHLKWVVIHKVACSFVGIG